MARLKFNKDAVSENIQQLISLGIGTRAPSGQGSAPLFTNKDVQVHAQAIGRTLSPIGSQEPLGQRIDGQGIDFRTLDNPDFNSIDDITIKIGELEGQKRENIAQLSVLLQTDPAIVSAESLVNQLSNELAITSDPKVRIEVQAELVQATKLLDTATEAGTKRAGVEQVRRNNLIEADISRLTARKQALVDAQTRKDTGKAKDPVNPKSAIDYVQAVGIAKTPQEADKFINKALPATRALIIKQASEFQVGTPMEIWDPLIDAGGRAMAESFILSSVPPSDMQATKIALERIAVQMAVAKKAAATAVKEESVKDATLRTDRDTIANRTAQIFDGIMRDTNFRVFEDMLLNISDIDLDPTWFPQGTGQLEIAQQITSLISSEIPGGLEVNFARAANQLIQQGSDRDLVRNTIGRIIDNQASVWNNINKHIGATVSRRKLQGKINALTLNQLNIERATNEALTSRSPLQQKVFNAARRKELAQR